jgi:hypothetical protein
VPTNSSPTSHASNALRGSSAEPTKGSLRITSWTRPSATQSQVTGRRSSGQNPLGRTAGRPLHVKLQEGPDESSAERSHVSLHTSTAPSHARVARRTRHCRASNAGTARLAAGSLVARLPRGMASLAVAVLIRDATDSYTTSPDHRLPPSRSLMPVSSRLQARLIDSFGEHCVLMSLGLLSARSPIALSVAAKHGSSSPLLMAAAEATGVTHRPTSRP